MPFIDMEFISNPSAEMEETVLWTNSDSSATFAAQDVTLSDNYDNYDYIIIYYCRVKTATSEIMKCMAERKYFDTIWNSNIKQGLYFSDNYGGSNSRGCYARRLVGTSTKNVLHFDSCLLWSTGNTDNTYCIPIKICGGNVVPKEVKIVSETSFECLYQGSSDGFNYTVNNAVIDDLYFFNITWAYLAGDSLTVTGGDILKGVGTGGYPSANRSYLIKATDTTMTLSFPTSGNAKNHGLFHLIK